LAKQDKDAGLKATFTPIAEALTANEAKIAAELIAAQGTAQDTGGYYKPVFSKVSAAMRPSATFNAIIDGI
jgi:isocitrate dehydrogenase